MSKRFALNLQYGERKKAKLDISMSDHHLPLSQNFGNSNKENDLDNWGDDNDDEMLLQASQACEQAISSDTSMLPEYSLWEPPGTTSTQFQPAPSTSKPAFIFKKPTANPPSAISKQLHNKFTTISSPLPGIANKFIPGSNECANLIDDLIIDEKVVAGKDNYTYNQILRLQEENEKLKAEYDKLQEKCVTKEGEASILRTQLKTCQMAVESARMEKTRAQENVKIEYTEKLATVKSQLSDLQTQLEFKNLEILNVKEKCKKLESGKRLTQITVPHHDISSKNNHIITTPYNSSQYIKRAHMTSNSVQTDHKASFLKLNKTHRKNISELSNILPYILEPTEPQHSLLDYNENLQARSDLSQNKCKVVNTFHRMPLTPGPIHSTREKVTVGSVVDDLVNLASGLREFENAKEKYYHFFSVLNAALHEVQQELEEISRLLNTSYQKEMDERYIEATSSYHIINITDLLKGQLLYKDEQAVCARRLLAVLAICLESVEGLNILRQYQTDTNTSLLDTALRICQLIDHCSGGVHYSGLLHSLYEVLERLLQASGPQLVTGVSACARAGASARGWGAAAARLLALTRVLALHAAALDALCPASASGNLKLDYDQGLQLYRPDSCYFQVLLKQTEVSLKCIEKLGLESEAVRIVEHLTALCGTLGHQMKPESQSSRCDCQVMLVQVLIYSLRICAVMWEKKTLRNEECGALAACARGALAALAAAAALTTPARLQHHGGLLADAADRLRPLAANELYGNILSELTSAFQPIAEDMVASYHPQPWEQSFENFSVAD